MLTRKTQFILLIIIILTTVIFWVSDLDMTVTDYFYSPLSQNSDWPISEKPFWYFFYEMAPVISMLIAFGSLLVIFGSLISKKWKHHRKAAYFILSVFVVGPGIIVNTIFKDNWGRPRPDQVVEFGGNHQYVPPLLFNSEGRGKSFPCGHSSVGYALIAFWFLWRTRRPKLAHGMLFGSLILGTLIGFSRLANGAHFLSDVLWSAWIPIFTASTLYYLFYGKGNHIPERKYFGFKEVIFTSLAMATMIGSLLAFPVEKKISDLTEVKTAGINTVCFIADNSEITITPSHNEMDSVSLSYRGKGFGLVGSQVQYTADIKESVLIYRFKKNGLYTEWHSQAELEIPEKWIRKVAIVSSNASSELKNNALQKLNIQQVSIKPGRSFEISPLNRCLQET